MAMGSFLAPYVHSNIYNFNGKFGGSSLDTRSDEGQNRLNAQIQELKQLRDILKLEADVFLGGQDWRTIMDSIDQIDHTFVKIGTDILNSQRAIDILSGKGVTYKRESLIKAFPQLQSEIMAIVGDAVELSAKEAVQIIVEIILRGLPQGGSLEAWTGALMSALANSAGKIEKSVASSVKGRLTSQKGKLKTIVKNTLKSRTRSKSKEKNAFAKYFESEFRARIAQENMIIPVDRMEEYLTNVISNFKTMPLETFTGDVSSMLGKLGEDFISVTMNGANTIGITFQVVGMETEETMQSKKQFSSLLNGSIKTHHKDSAESQTDLLLTNAATGKTVRVQSKNLQAAYQSVINIDRKSFPGMARLQQETSYIGLIEKLQGTSTIHLSEEDLADLSYLLANEVWFRAKGSYPGGGARGVSDSGSILGQTARGVGQLFAKEIANFMGVTIDQSITVNHGQASSFNSFYLISNKILLPSWKIIDDLISQLQQAETEFSRLQVTINTSSASGSAKAFYEAKVEATQPEGLKADGDYSDANLVAVGSGKGAEIISSLSISNVGLKFDIGALLNSSWSL